MENPSRILIAICACASMAMTATAFAATPVDTSALRGAVTVDGVRDHQLALQIIADNNGGTRQAGTSGYDESAAYVAEQLASAGYAVELQEFDFVGFEVLGPSTLDQTAPTPTPYVEETDYTLMDQTDPGNVVAAVSSVDLALGDPGASSSGCEIEDFAGFSPGNIALIQRGTCTFQLKAENAAASGAVGAIIFNQGNSDDRTGLINGTLSAEYSGGIPVVFATFDRGVEWANTAGLVMRLIVNTARTPTTTVNVIAETAGGRSDRVVVVGAHLDSVAEGPGLQDNGTGSAAILEIAVKMADLGITPRNKVRFAWWGAEESGLVGSQHYVDNLSPRDIKDIAVNLNFDMIGSPNFVRFVYDGDGSHTEVAGPNGSANVEDVFLGYFESQGLATEPTAFDGRSDYGPFIAVGIPAGGLFTGAEEIKTEEEVAVYGGVAGDQYDPCYHLACDTFDNISLEALDQMSDAAAHATLTFAMTTSSVNGTDKASAKAMKSVESMERLGAKFRK